MKDDEKLEPKVYKIEYILKKGKNENNETIYLPKWEGYKINKSNKNWIKRDDLYTSKKVKKLIDNFNKKRKLN